MRSRLLCAVRIAVDRCRGAFRQHACFSGVGSARAGLGILARLQHRREPVSLGETVREYCQHGQQRDCDHTYMDAGLRGHQTRASETRRQLSQLRSSQSHQAEPSAECASDISSMRLQRIQRQRTEGGRCGDHADDIQPANFGWFRHVRPRFRVCTCCARRVSKICETGAKCLKRMVPQKGFEPLTPSLRMTCSTD